MTISIALFLSSGGIALAHLQKAGHWAIVNEVALDAPDLEEELAKLHAQAVERTSEEAKALLVLPDDQVLYTSFTAPSDDLEQVTQRIESGLDGLTPYPVSELEYDWRSSAEDRVKVAVVAKETLDEARDFVRTHGFEPAGFAATPPVARFPGVPFFALTEDSSKIGISAEGIAFGPDQFRRPASANAAPEPETPPASDAANEPKSEGQQQEMFVEPETSAPGQSPNDTSASPSLEIAHDPATDPIAPMVEQPAAQATVAPAAQTAAPEITASDEVEAKSEPGVQSTHADASSDRAAPESEADLAPIADPGLGAPIIPIDESAPSHAPPDPAPEIDAADDLPPPISPAVREAALRARIIRGEEPAEAASKPRVPPLPTVPPGDTTTPETTAPTAKKPPLAAPKRAKQIGSSFPPLATERNTERARDAVPPLQRGKPGADVSKPFSAEPDEPSARPPTRPAITPPSRPRVEIPQRPRAPERPSPFDAPPSAKLSRDGQAKTGLLARLRPEKANTSGAAGLADAPPAPGGSAAPSSAASSGSGFRLPKLSAMRGPAPAERDASIAQPDAEPQTDQAAPRAAALGRDRVAAKPQSSFRTGLILTLILLGLLVIIGIWSVLFLPSSPASRWFGSETQVASAPDSLARPDTASPNASFSDEAAADGINGAAELPGIDADLELPPLPPTPEELLPSLSETQELYAQDGIWVRPPERPAFEPFTLVDPTDTAAIDPAVEGFDAVALPDEASVAANAPRRQVSPPPFGTEFTTNEDGLIAPTPSGVLTPDGAFVIAGRPSADAQPRPRIFAEPAPETVAPGPNVAALRPVARPNNLAETRERQLLGGLTQSELAAIRPGVRPASPQETAAETLAALAATSASLAPAPQEQPQPEQPQTIAETAPVAPQTPLPEATVLVVEGTQLAVARSAVPASRPSNIAQIVANASRAPAPQPVAVAPTSVAAAPSIPSNSDVSRAATERNTIRLRNINLIGVTGTPSNRRALVRLQSGRFVRVGVGDQLDGGRVAAIGETTLQYVRRGRTVTLEIPG